MTLQGWLSTQLKHEGDVKVIAYYSGRVSRLETFFAFLSSMLESLFRFVTLNAEGRGNVRWILARPVFQSTVGSLRAFSKIFSIHSGSSRIVREFIQEG